MQALNMSGVNDCPCCGTAVMCANEFQSEMCDECKGAECDPLAPCALNDGLDL